jgi:hypothetical protein
MGAFDDLIPGNSQAKPRGAFDDLIPSAPADMPANASGVQDWEPIQTRHIGLTELPQDEAAGWATTRIRNAAAGIAGFPRAMADITDAAGKFLGVDPATWRGGMNAAFPITAVGRMMPNTQQIKEGVAPYLPTVNAPGPYGKVVDAAAEGAVSGLALGGGASSVVPSVMGGAASELAGQATEGAPWEPAARVLGGLFGGGVAAFGQNALQTMWQGWKNFKAPNTDAAAGKILENAAKRDKMTVEEVLARQRALGEGATLAEAGGPNVRGTVRGSIAAPGEARTNVANAFENRLSQIDDQVTTALDKNITPLNSLGTTVDEISALRSQQATPAYEAAGIPRKIVATETTGFAPLKTQTVPEYPYMKSGPKKVVEEFGPPAPITTKSFNSPNVTSPEIEFLLKNSPDVQTAINAARRLPQFKDLPDNSMVMLDKAYKHLNGMEQEAIRSGNGTRAFDLGNLRKQFEKALTDANPKYKEALDAYSGPSKLIDAATKGREWFTKNVDPVMVRREFQGMTPDQREAAMVGVRDWARDVAGRSDRATVAERVWTSENNRQRFQALLDTPGFEKLSGTMETAKNAARTTRDIGVGSRTAPMLNEQADNALQMGPAVALMQGRPVNAAVQYGQNLLARVTNGQTEAVNARLAEIATLTDPSKVGLVVAAANKAKLEAAARAGDRSSYWAGAAIPTFNALVGR